MRQLCSAVSSSGTRKNTIAPTTGPHSRPAPPNTTISRKKIEKSAVKSSGVTTVFWTANSAPASPAIAALVTKAIILMRTSETPAAIPVQQVDPDRHQHVGRHLRGDEQAVFGADRERREVEGKRQPEQQRRPGAR